MGFWAIVAATFGGCSPAEEVAEADTSRPVGIDRETFDRLYRDRYCSEWAVCNSTGAPCPISPGTSPFATDCAFDGVAAQACVVGRWDCESSFQGYEYPVQPQVCYEVCGYGTYRTF